MVRRDLEKNPEILAIPFNGWLFEGYSDAKSALMGTILQQISAQRTLGPEAKTLFERLIKRVDWFQVASLAAKGGLALATGGVSLVGVGVSAIGGLLSGLKDKVKEAQSSGKTVLDLEAISGLIKDEPDEDLRESIMSFRQDFEVLLADTNIKTLVVFIDDLDRCTPDTIIETLEAIRLFLYVPHTAFVLGADERLVRYAVRRRFPELPGERAEVGRDYLEKLIQFPVRVPSMGRSEMESYIGLLFANLSLSEEDFEKIRTLVVSRDASRIHDACLNYETAETALGAVKPELREQLLLARRLAPVLTSGLNGNPRQCKRFLNTLMMRLGMARSRKVDLNIQMLAKLMVLEYFRPESFKQLAVLQGEQSGKPAEILKLESAVASSQDSRPSPTATKVDPKELDASKEGQPLSDKLQPWLDDSLVREWVSMEPSLGGTDLRPYFYFSRDTLGPIPVHATRLTPEAQEALANLLSASEAVTKIGIDKMKSLSPSDAAGVFQVLSDKASSQGDQSGLDAALKILHGVTDARPELLSQLVTLIGRIPERSIPLWVPPALMRIPGAETPGSSAHSLLDRISSSTEHPGLASVTKSLQSRRKKR